MSMEKIKVLITGPVNGSYQDLQAKLTTLQNSKAGPFDVCFCTGAFFSSSSSRDDANTIRKEGFVLPTYFCDVGVLPSGMTLPTPEEMKDEAEISIDDDDDEDEDNEEEEKDEKDKNDANEQEKKLLAQGIVKVGPNLYHLHGLSQDSTQTGDVLNIHVKNESTYLTVAFLPPNARMGSAQTSRLESKLKHAAYVGCDILLTSEWGQGMANSPCISQEYQQQLKIGNPSLDLNELGSFDVAELVSQCRPRYHFCPPAIKKDSQDDGVFFLQSVPYSNPPSKMSSGVIKSYHPSRFLVLCPVVDSKTAKVLGKKKKFVHAVGLQPLWSMDQVTATTIPQGQTVLSNPYTDEAYVKDGPSGDSGTYGNGRNISLSDAQARRIMSEESGGDQFRWNVSGRKRPLGSNDSMAVGVDPTNCTLFMHGLHRDTSGGAYVNPGSIAQTFQPFGSVNVRFPQGHKAKSYCFIEFESHEKAKTCLEQTSGFIDIGGVQLTLKWGSGGNRGPPPPPPPGFVGIMPGAPPHSKKQRTENLKEAEAADSCNLFVHFDVAFMSEQQSLLAMTCIEKFAQKILEDAINDDSTNDENRVTAQEEPALKVTSVAKIKFGFLEFASHAAASMALATMTGSTDGGALQDMTLLEKETDLHELINGRIQVFWAKHSPKKDSANRAYSQLDARKDCWFCLASPTCEKHLIVEVSDHCYITMPKGPVNKRHTLIVPIAHIPGVYLDPSPGLEEEVEQAKHKLKKIAAEEWDMDLFVYERAMPTKGGYHSHINCIPIERGLTTKIYSAMMEKASTCGFAMKEIQNSEISLSTILKNSDDDDSQVCGYMLIEVTGKRFLYKFKPDDDKIFIPIEFGRDVLASVLGDQKVAQWKNCILSKEKEEETCNEFRNILEKY